MPKVKQTSRAILFEEYDKDQLNLATIIGNASEENLFTDKLDEDIDKLTVKSFREFLAKFMPKVYEMCQNIDGRPVFSYTINPMDIQGRQYVEKKISEHAYYEMLDTMYRTKGSSGDSNLKFDDRTILELLSPKRDVEAAYDLRNRLQLNWDKFYEAKDKGESTQEYKTKITECRKQIMEQYTGSQSNLIPIYLEDLNTKIKQLEEGKKVAQKAENDGVKAIGNGAFGVLAIASNGRLEVKELPACTEDTQAASSATKRDTGKEIAETIRKDYDKLNTAEPNAFVKDLVVSAYAPMALSTGSSNLALAEVEQKIQEYKEQRDILEYTFSQSKQSFIDALSQIVQRLLGVKIFFDHATTNGGDNGELTDKLIVANCKITKLLATGVADKFKAFMIHRGKGQTDERIWFAVVPDVAELQRAPQNSEDTSDDGPAEEIIVGDEQKNLASQQTVDMGRVKDMLKIMEEAKIVTVFNRGAYAENTFSGLTVKEVRSRKEEFKNDNFGHAVYAYPNFTLTRERHYKPFEEYSNRELILPGISIGAAYVAAGLLVASQQISFLDKCKLNPITENDCVGVDLEQGEVKQKVLTKFNRENSLRWNDDLRKIISDDMFGFVFCSDDVSGSNGELLKNTYILFARSLRKNQHNKYSPIYQTLIEDYVGVCIKRAGNKYSEVQQLFIKGDVDQWKKQNEIGKYKKRVNLVLREEEDIEINTETMKVHIKFNNDDTIVEGFDIVSDSK